MVVDDLRRAVAAAVVAADRRGIDDTSQPYVATACAIASLLVSSAFTFTLPMSCRPYAASSRRYVRSSPPSVIGERLSQRWW